MALDFPNSPTLGQLFTSGALTWRWDGAKWVAATLATGLYFPNKLINPFMEIDQANEGASVNAVNYIIDGFAAFNGSAGTLTGQRVTDAPPGYPYSLRIQQTVVGSLAAGSYAQIKQPIEADDIADTRFGTSAAQNLSLAFWAKASLAGTYSAALLHGSIVRSYVFPFVISAANTWQFFSQVIPGDTGGAWTLSGNSTGMSLVIGLTAGSGQQVTTLNAWQTSPGFAPSTISNTMLTTLNSTFQLGPCGLWVAPAPQPLLRTSIETELSRCQRYYEKSYDTGQALGSNSSQGGSLVIGTQGTVTTNINGSVPFSVAKRAAPTMTMYGLATASTPGKGSYWNGTAYTDYTGSFPSAGVHGFNCVWPSVTSPTTTGFMITHWAADSRL